MTDEEQRKVLRDKIYERYPALVWLDEQLRTEEMFTGEPTEKVDAILDYVIQEACKTAYLFWDKKDEGKQ